MDVNDYEEAVARFRESGVITPPAHLAAETLVYVEEWIVAATKATRLDEIEMIFKDLVSETEYNRFVSQVADDCPF